MTGIATSAIVSRATSPTVTLYLAAGLLGMSMLAGWSLWRLASAGARCDAKIAQAQARGSAAVQKLVADQEAALAMLKTRDDARLMAIQAAIPARQVERVTIYRDRVRTVSVPECRISSEQVQAINEVLK